MTYTLLISSMEWLYLHRFTISFLILSFEKGGFWWQGCVSERVAAGEAGPEVDPDGPGRGLGNPEGEHQTH